MPIISFAPSAEPIPEPSAGPAGLVVHADGRLTLRVPPVAIEVRLTVTDALMIAAALAEYARRQIDLDAAPPAGRG